MKKTDNNTGVTVLKQKDDKNNPASLLKIAVEKNAGVEQLEKLMGLQERWEKTQAEKAFNQAMANAQRRFPVIKKRSVVRNKPEKGGGVRYKFAPMGDIITQVKDIIADEGLFYDFKTEDEKEFMNVICTVTHFMGHSKATSFKIPIGKEDHMSDVQKYGARVTFASRYAFSNAFGIRTADEDTDAAGTGKEKEAELFPLVDKKQIADDLLRMNTEKEVFDYALGWDKYKNVQEFKVMLRVRIANIPAKNRMSEQDRREYKAAKGSATPFLA